MSSKLLNFEFPRPLRSTGGLAVQGLLIALFAASLLLTLLFSVFGKVVPPNFIGVRQNYFSFYFFEKGFVSRGLSPGLHWTIPMISEIKLLPRGFQYVHFNDAAQAAGIDLPSLDIPTRDGSKVKTDVTLIVRLFSQPNTSTVATPLPVDPSTVGDDKVPLVERRERTHGGPRDLVENFRLEPADQLRSFARVAEDELRRGLGRLSTTDYYNPAVRETAAINAYEAINTSVNPKGMELWGNLIRRYTYLEKTIDDQIFQKNLQEQTERLNAGMSKLAGAQAETEKGRALWDAKIRDLEVQGDSRKQVLRSEGDLYETSRNSEGDRLVAEAKAEVDQLRARALTELAGSQVYVAREMAPLLRTLSGGVVTDLDPYDVGSWIKRLLSKPELQGGTR